MSENVDRRVGATMGRMGDRLYLAFSGEDAASAGRLANSLAALRSRFPGHDDAIRKADSIHYVPRTTIAEWNLVPSAASYTVEIDCFHCCGRGKWCTDVGSTWKIVPGLTGMTYTFDWVGAQPGRWRVWAIDYDGRSTSKSAWTYFDYSW